MAQIIKCEFKIKIIISANMEESSEENIKAVKVQVFFPRLRHMKPAWTV